LEEEAPIFALRMKSDIFMGLEVVAGLDLIGRTESGVVKKE
jgi:hypothetical protein